MFFFAQIELSGEQLDVLAMLFTAVKILFVGGAIARVTRLIQVLTTHPKPQPCTVGGCIVVRLPRSFNPKMHCTGLCRAFKYGTCIAIQRGAPHGFHQPCPYQVALQSERSG